MASDSGLSSRRFIPSGEKHSDCGVLRAFSRAFEWNLVAFDGISWRSPVGLMESRGVLRAFEMTMQFAWGVLRAFSRGVLSGVWNDN